MSQIENGIRSILSHPKVYDLFQELMGAHKVRTDFVENYVKPSLTDCILDIGCGTADLLAYLPESIRYFGYDQSQSYIDHAIQQFGSRGTFKCALVDTVEVSQLPEIDIAIASGLIHHLSDRQTITLLETAHSALAGGGRFIAIDPCYKKGQHFIAKSIIDRDRGESVRDQPGYKNLARIVFTNIDSYVVHRKWIPYTHHIMVCSK